MKRNDCYDVLLMNQAFQKSEEIKLTADIKGTVRLIKQEKLRLLTESPGNRNTLPFPTG